MCLPSTGVRRSPDWESGASTRSRLLADQVDHALELQDGGAAVLPDELDAGVALSRRPSRLDYARLLLLRVARRRLDSPRMKLFVWRITVRGRKDIEMPKREIRTVVASCGFNHARRRIDAKNEAPRDSPREARCQRRVSAADIEYMLVSAEIELVVRQAPHSF